MKILIILIGLTLISCAKKSDLNKLNHKLGDVETTLNDHEKRLLLLEQVNTLTVQDVNDIYETRIQLIEQNIANTNFSIVDIENDINDLEYILSQVQAQLALIEQINIQNTLQVFDSRLTTIESTLSSIALNSTEIQLLQTELVTLQQDILSLNERIDQNDLFRDMPGCVHSYFVLYDATSKIKALWFTENDGTVAGAWEASHNQTYSLLIDGQTTCTQVKFDKNQKKLYYTNSQGSQVVDLSY